MKRSYPFCMVILAAAFLTTSCAVFTGDASGGKRVALFDGKTLDGWTVLNCEATVDHGDILLVAGNGLVQTEKQYGNFILEFDWKALRDEKWDSGVYFRYDSVPEGRPWPDRYQVNLRYDMAGHVGSLEDARTEGLVKAGQWNR
ncbi:MAG: DUF1080 domain-containing protein, partial [Phycisphaerales bacterium]